MALSFAHRRRLAAVLSVMLVTAVACAAGGAARAADWPVFNHDAGRSGYAAGDHILSPANVGKLRRRWVTTFDDIADSTPILLSRVRMPGGGTRALLFQTTKKGTTYAVDARSGAIVWRFSTPSPRLYPISPGSRKITTSTPAADPSGRYIYAPGIDGQVHKLVAATGVEMHGLGFPLRITLMPDVEKDASALNIANGYLYAATSGFIGDEGPYDGHIVTLRLRDGATTIFNSLCSAIHHLLLDKGYDAGSRYSCAQRESGIWSRGGVVVDPDPAMGGRIYATTGNGPFDANHGGSNYGDSVLALRKDGARLLDSFTPANYADLEANDTDLGSTAPALLPREPGSKTPLMAVQGGKDETIRLLNRAHLGGVGGELQDLHVPGAFIFSAPAVWRQPGGSTWIYLGDSSNVVALRLVTDGRGISRLRVSWTTGSGGASPLVSNGMVFVSTNGALNAYDARTGHLLWTSTRPAAGGSIGAIHWESPVVVDGWAYISDESGHLTAYTVSR